MRLVILDRDGVINEDSDEFIKSVAEWRPLPGSLEAIARLTQAHVHVVVVTNQSGISRGLFDVDTLHQIHALMQRELAQWGGRIDAIYYCPHGPDDDCNCRKPRAGMFRDLAKRLQMDLTDVAAIGDSLRDLQAAQTVKARPILVRTGKGRRTEEQGEGLVGVEVFDDLSAAVDQLLSEMA
jgi:D-glycero-D-manno-heptose 1,7-bisphosphate phosphatase